MDIVFGKNGQLGYRMLKLIPEAIAYGRDDIDFSNIKLIENWKIPKNCRNIFNCAAYTYVDKAEEDKVVNYNVNVISPKIIATKCNESKTNLFYISSDYVFGGESRGRAWIETDPLNPINTYGCSKRDGERFVIESGCSGAIIRTSWVFGGPTSNFVDTMLRLGRERETINIVDDQFGSPTFSKHLAQVLVDISRSEKILKSPVDIIHVSNSGFCSWKEFAEYIFVTAKEIGFSINVKKVVGVSSSEYPAVAQRPKWSVLDTKKLEEKYGIVMPDWKDAVKEYLNEKFYQF